MCSSVQDGIVQTDIVINGITRTNKVFTRLLGNGDIVEQSFTWVPSFNAAGGFVEAVEVQSQRTICSVEVTPTGCPVDCAENAEKLFSCGCMVDYYVPYMRTRYPSLYNEYGYYKKEEEKRRVHIFSKTGRKSRIKQAEIVFQSNGDDMLIPQYATMAFKALLDWTRKMYSPSFIPYDRNEAKRNYRREEMAMLKYLNPIPYEMFVQNGSYGNNMPSRPLYGGSYGAWGEPSDQQQQVRQPASIAPVVNNNITNVTNVTNSAGNLKLPLIGIVDDGGPNDPVSGLDTFQSDDLKGLGVFSNGKIKIEVDDNTMSSFGQNKSFNYDPSLGLITFTTGFVWQPQSTLWVNLNQ